MIEKKDMIVPQKSKEDLLATTIAFFISLQRRVKNVFLKPRGFNETEGTVEENVSSLHIPSGS